MIALVCLFAPSLARAGDEASFQAASDVLATRCYECHNATNASGGLDLSQRTAILKGGDSGPAFDAETPAESLVLERVSNGEMPPKKNGKARPLSKSESAALKTWMTSGAPWPNGRVLDPFARSTESHAGRDFWSLQPIREVAVPVVNDASNPIDAFILRDLEARKWTLAPEADRATLIRRVSIDLTGLPPSYEQVKAFVSDKNPDAYEKLVDRLLASRHFGERWGRYWLDVARYADTCGYERDQTKENAWKYRDWVIQAINADMPFAQFVTEQLAGDELPNRTEASLIATGFIRLGTWNDEPNDPQEYKYERLEDMVHATSTAFLGMTVKCARCHDHKFDPIRQTDYYRMAAAFWSGPIEPGNGELLGGPDAKTLGSNAFAWTDTRKEPPPLHLLIKGEPARPGPIIRPGQLSMVPSLDRPLEAPPANSRTSTRRLQLARWIADPANPLAPRVWVNRLWQNHLGAGLVRSSDNFGQTGDRPTNPDLLDWLAREFLRNGGKSKPLHRMIVLSRVYRQSAVHPKQAEYAASDAGNRLWWHAERKRLDADSLRDALLLASGSLDLKYAGGPGFTPSVPDDALEGLSDKTKAWTASPAADQKRRAIYMFQKRGLLAPFMTTFDAPDTTLPCAKRDVTLVPPQALALMNNEFTYAQSTAVAQMVLKRSHSDTKEQVRLAWRAALARDPSDLELKNAEAHLRDQAKHFQDVLVRTKAKTAPVEELALTSLCHVLLNTNEFLYVD